MANERVLIVEDERIIAEDLSDILTTSGYEVIGISASGKDALEKAHAARPELVSMDIRIRGDMDGIETAKRIKGAFDIPIIFMTSNSDDETLTRAKAVSSWVLSKPLDKKELLETAAKALRDKCLE